MHVGKKIAMHEALPQISCRAAKTKTKQTNAPLIVFTPTPAPGKNAAAAALLPAASLPDVCAPLPVASEFAPVLPDPPGVFVFALPTGVNPKFSARGPVGGGG